MMKIRMLLRTTAELAARPNAFGPLARGIPLITADHPYGKAKKVCFYKGGQDISKSEAVDYLPEKEMQTGSASGC